jgi:hypothetical protein
MLVPLLLALSCTAVAQDREPAIKAPYFGAEASLTWPMRVTKEVTGGDALRDIAEIESLETTALLAIAGYRFRKWGADVRAGLGPLVGFTVTDPQVLPGLGIRAAVLLHARWFEPTDFFFYMGFDRALFFHRERPGDGFHGDLGFGVGGEFLPDVWTQVRLGVAGQTVQFRHDSGDRVTFGNFIVTAAVTILGYRPKKQDPPPPPE